KIYPDPGIGTKYLSKSRNQEGQEQQHDENVFPKHDHRRVEKLVERNTPGALRPPESSAKADEPGAVPRALNIAFLHATRLNVRLALRQRGLSLRVVRWMFGVRRLRLRARLRLR